MTRIISFLTTIFIALQSLFGIGGMTFGKVTIVPEYDSYPVGTLSIKAVLYNGTLRPIEYFPPFRLDTWDGNEWILVKANKVPGEEVPLYVPIELSRLTGVEQTFHFFRYDPLIAGRYRITKWLTGNTVSAEFRIVGSAATLTTSNYAYPLNTEVIQATWYNGTEQLVWFGPSFEVEQWDGSTWAAVEPKEPVSYPAVVYPLEPFQSMNHTYGLSYYDVEPGLYRIAATYVVEGGAGSAVTNAVFELW